MQICFPSPSLYAVYGPLDEFISILFFPFLILRYNLIDYPYSISELKWTGFY